ncbi:hypothetical protein PIB30_023921 [Stylosanthes scabra]|uniref:Uncharacterized protein n=1 Tax=Stylosanthes scabra TaxID=79078 RepID=A0ABU6U8K1_9FABA|nr:hypothetical protein [Stylosanthes scabra]
MPVKPLPSANAAFSLLLQQERHLVNSRGNVANLVKATQHYEFTAGNKNSEIKGRGKGTRGRGGDNRPENVPIVLESSEALGLMFSTEQKNKHCLICYNIMEEIQIKA